MKILLLTPDSYSIKNTIIEGFNHFGHTVVHIDHYRLFSGLKRKFDIQSFRLPFNMRKKWKEYVFEQINRQYIDTIQNENPDVLFIYNNQMVLPQTLQLIKNKIKIIFYLGDNPFYTPTSIYNLEILFFADYIFAPDTFWLEQLNSIGLNKLCFEIIGTNKKQNYPIEPSDDEYKKYKSDAIFIGNTYIDAWGYKRTLFLNQFKDFDLKIYGTKNWLRWLEIFPDLKPKFNLLKKPLSFDEVNLLSNCSKIYPVEVNPGLLNGLHIRTFDCISSGVLPIVEYRKDIDLVFENMEFPYVKNYNDAAEIGKYFIENDERRDQLLKLLQNHIENKYRPEHTIKRILDKIEKE